MYLKYISKNNWHCEEIYIDNNEDGLRKAIWKVCGENVNKLIQEKGNHRFTRYSPFSKNKKLHTSFVGVNVEKANLDKKIDINKNDVDMSFFKGSGAGGQHRNKVETGVRLIHKPTGIVVESVSERSQHHNRAIAWERLAIKLVNMEKEKSKHKNHKEWNEKNTIGFGDRKRTYKLEMSIIKDEISGKQTNQIQKILDGNLDIFID